MSRVLSTLEAKQAVTKMRTIINQGLLEQITSLDHEGRTLCDPNVWDGQLAGVFRNDWPQTSQALQRIRQDLETLRSKVQQVNQDIMTAGGNAG